MPYITAVFLNMLLNGNTICTCNKLYSVFRTTHRSILHVDSRARVKSTRPLAWDSAADEHEAPWSAGGQEDVCVWCGEGTHCLQQPRRERLTEARRPLCVWGAVLWAALWVLGTALGGTALDCTGLCEPMM